MVKMKSGEAKVCAIFFTYIPTFLVMVGDLSAHIFASAVLIVGALF